MDIVKEKIKNNVILRLSGRLDAQQAEHLAEALDDVLSSGEHQMQLDMHQVVYISSAGIRILLRYYQNLHKIGGAFTLIRPSEIVRSVIELTGLTQLFEAASTQDASREKTQSTGSTRHFDTLSCTIQEEITDASVVCTLHGAPQKLSSGAFTASDMMPLTLPRNTFGLGLGSFGDNFEDCRPRFGEFLAAGGAAAYLPADSVKNPDYFIEQGQLAPTINSLYALTGTGAYAQRLRFDTRPDNGGATLCALVQAALTLSRAPRIALIALAETKGLVGASLKHAPTETEAANLFAHPEIRQWLRFTPERSHERSLAWIVGVASTKEDPQLAPFLRPLQAEPALYGHFHAAAFSYRALPKGQIALVDTLASLFEEQSLLSVLHLLNDTRPITGIGDSLFARGALWASPITTIQTA